MLDFIYDECCWRVVDQHAKESYLLWSSFNSNEAASWTELFRDEEHELGKRRSIVSWEGIFEEETKRVHLFEQVNFLV